jgi:hypothetical protein
MERQFDALAKALPQRHLTPPGIVQERAAQVQREVTVRGAQKNLRLEDRQPAQRRLPDAVFR